MEVKIIHNSSIAYEFLKNQTRYDYIYQFSNMSPELWEKVICFGLFDQSEIKELCMLNMNYDIPVLLAASFGNPKCNIELIKRIKKFLPSKFYTHIDKETLQTVFSQNNICQLEEYMNMGLSDYSQLNEKLDNKAVRIGFKDINDIKKILAVSHPDAWLDDELVKLNENFGRYEDGKLICFAGIHAYSEQYKVAAVAHVTTHHNYRRRGYAKEVVAALSSSLKNKIDFIGLNVKMDNFKAINCYKKLGFQEYGKFVACEIENYN